MLTYVFWGKEQEAELSKSSYALVDNSRDKASKVTVPKDG